MKWKHHYSLLVSVMVSVMLVITRPDLESWHLLPFSLWPGGHIAIFKIERRKMSPRVEKLKEDLEMDKMKKEHDRNMMYSWGERHVGAVFALCFVGLFGIILFIMYGLPILTLQIPGGCEC